MNIPAELRLLLQIPNDAAAFVMAMFRSFFAPLRTIHNRVVTRTGISSVTVADVDPRKAGQQSARITMRDSGSDPGRLAARMAIMIVERGKASLYIDEARRWASGQPIGTSRSLDADDDGEAAPIRSLDRRLMGARTLDPITLTIIVGVGVPLLCALIPGLLPMIIEWGKSAFASITNTPAGPVDGGAALPEHEREFGLGAITNPFSDVFDSFTGGPGDGDPTNDTRNAVIVGALVVGTIYLITRK